MRGHIVVTGCAGFIGSHLADRLLAGIDRFVQSHVCVLHRSTADDGICMLLKWR